MNVGMTALSGDDGMIERLKRSEPALCLNQIRSTATHLGRELFGPKMSLPLGRALDRT